MPLKEGSLGIGISIRKNPRTGLISYVNPTMDLMNMRSFTKMKVRKALHGEQFTHWLPLYFGENESFKIHQDNYDHELEDMVTTTRDINTFERFQQHA